MKTITIQIGNSDDKLTQKAWARFVKCVDDIATSRSNAVHFAGGSHTEAMWQNYCWVVEIPDDKIEGLCAALRYIRMECEQDSVAVTVGRTNFI